MPNILWFQLLKWEDLLLSIISCDSNMSQFSLLIRLQFEASPLLTKCFIIFWHSIDQKTNHLIKKVISRLIMTIIISLVAIIVGGGTVLKSSTQV